MRVFAWDEFMINALRVYIYDADGTLLETAETKGIINLIYINTHNEHDLI